MQTQDPIKQALRDFVATSNSGKYKNEDELLSKFPELSGFDKQALRDFVATSNSGKYKTEDEVFSKFPEFDVKKKEPTTPTFGQDVSAKLNLKTPTPFTPSYGAKSQSGGTKPKKNIDYLNEIEGLYKQKVSTSQERLDYRRQLKDLEPKINELTSQVTALEAAYNDVNLPLQERNAAAQQLNVLTPQVQELSSTYDLAAKNYYSLSASDKRLATEIEQV